MSKFCRNCGTPLSDEATFCGKCGTPVSVSAVPDLPSRTSLGGDPLKLGVIIAGVLVVLSTFLPYASVSMFGFSQSVSLIDGGDGFIFIATAAVAIVGVLINKRILTLIGGIVTAFLALFELVNMNSELGDLAGMVDKGFGFYLSILASIVLAVLGVLVFLAGKKSK